MNTMFGFHAAMALEIVAAIAAAFLIVVAANRVGVAKTIGTWVGSLGLLLSATGIACTTYYGVAYWNEGAFSPKAVAADEQMQEMMGSMMSSMQKMHGGMMGKMAPSDAKDHHPSQQEPPSH